ncbi:hypothetical protein [Deinococcus ruber]|uniref:Uncharacterized protein n=1 Tax=Deinococcus ruber TaxID=1848197 RepID=A0A918KV01_9DEIO|nr:hypothetical protein [Deinococcus ruber]GGR34965.1 hypothetical protein GCM10008957_51210 [Deinococcus ruber]
MSDPAFPDPAILNRARGVLNLFRGAAGGERVAARGALTRLLSTHGLYLDDLEAGLPHSQNPDDLEGWRPALGWLAALGTDAQDDALNRLIEVEDLSLSERRRVLERLSLPALVASRAAGWRETAADPELEEVHLIQAGQALGSEQVAQDTRPVAEAVRQLTLQAAWLLARPERRLKASNALHAEFLAGLVEGLTQRRARIEEVLGSFTVLARLGVGELSRFRSAAAQHEARLDTELLRAARRFGKDVGRSF